MKSDMKAKQMILYAACFLVAVLLAACSSSEEVNEVEEPVMGLGETLKTQFTISVPQTVKSGTTRMSQATVQATGNFRGINQIKLFPSAVDSASFTENDLIGKSIELSRLLRPSDVALPTSNAVPQTLLAGSKSVLYSDVQLQIGTRSFLFYGKAVAGSNYTENADNQDYTYYFKYGHLKPTGLDGVPENVSGFMFEPKSITTAAASSTKRGAIVAYLNRIADSKVSGTGGEAWATTDNVGYKNLYTAFTGMKAGSSANLQAAINDLYFALKDHVTPLATAICSNIISTDYVTQDASTDSLTFKADIAGYPEASDHLPAGAAVLDYGTDETSGTSTFKFVETSANYDQLNVTSLTQYAYPASLYYRVLSNIRTAEELKTDYFTGTMTWDNGTNGIFKQYAEANNAITSKTRSVILTAPVQYAVGRLDVSVVKVSGSDVLDKAGTAVDLSKVKLTGILIGGQKKVDWKFQPIAGTAENPSTEYTIYDNLLISQKPDEGAFDGVALSTSVDNYIAHTLVLETAGGDDEKVKVALEFVNLGPEFVGKTGIVPTGTKFYLVGELDISKVTAAEKDKTGGKVFKQDYNTLAQFTISDLTKAENTIPDLRNPKVELGLSVDLSWTKGITFTYTFEND